MTTTVRARPARGIHSSPRSRAFARAGVGAGILLAIIRNVGAKPFIRGLASVSAVPAAAAFALGGATTLAAAWRWRILARRLGLTPGWGDSVSAYYRSQFLNTVLPGGVIGDIHRAVTHGRSVSRTPQASRAVVAERTAGQAVQLVLAVVVLVSVGVSGYAPAVSTVLLAVAVACVGVIVAAAVSGRARLAVTRELITLRSAFAAAGLGVAAGIAASTAFGVLARIAVAPGAAVVAASALRRRHDMHEARQAAASP